MGSLSPLVGSEGPPEDRREPATPCTNVIHLIPIRMKLLVLILLTNFKYFYSCPWVMTDHVK